MMDYVILFVVGVGVGVLYVLLYVCLLVLLFVVFVGLFGMVIGECVIVLLCWCVDVMFDVVLMIVVVLECLLCG